MIQTLKANNGTFANLGSVQIQPAKPTTSVVQQQSIAPVAANPIPAAQAMISLPVSIVRSSVVAPVNSPTLSSIANLIQTQPLSIVPFHAALSQIMPTHALTLDAGQMYDPRTTQGFVNTNTKFLPYELLTGIASQRPEIVMLTNFQPLFNKDVSHTAPNYISYFEDAGLSHFMTDAGRYFDTQFYMRNLQVFNVEQQVNSVVARYPGLNQTFLQRADDITQALIKLKSDSSFLLNLVRVLEAQKNQLDLRHDLYVVDPHELSDFVIKNFTQLNLSINPSIASAALSRLVEVAQRPAFNCVDCLVDLGYSNDAVVNAFSSTKIWMQLVAESKNILKHHSLQLLDIDPTYQRNDTNPTTILAPPTKFFGISSNLPTLPTLDELINLQVSNVPKISNSLKTTFDSIYQNSFFKNEEARIAGLAQILSHEYRYSYALTRAPVQKALLYYGYTVNPQGNTTVFDSVFGRAGNNITDFPAVSETSVSSIAQHVDVPVGVLTFETKYVDGDTGTLTPGGDFYFDRILETDGKSFNTTAIDNLATTLDNQLSQLNIVVDGFNMFELPGTNPTAGVSIESSFLNNTNDTVASLLSQLLNPSTGKSLPVAVNDRLGAVYLHARNDSSVKTALFMYTLARISRNYAINVPFFVSSPTADNTPLVDNLIDQILSKLESSTPDTRTTVQFVTRGNGGLSSGALTHNSVKTALKAGTPLTTIVEQFMSNVISQFRVKTTSIQNNFSRYGGYLDTVIMMVAFDLVISAVARYSNQQIVGIHAGLNSVSQGQVTFAVTNTSSDHSISFNELVHRVASETILTKQLLLTIINALRKLSGSLRGISNYLKGSEAKSSLNDIATVLQGNTDMLRMLFNEQQIMLLSSTVNSLLAAKNTSGGSGRSTHDTNVAEKEIVLLDESDVAPSTRAAVLGYFGSDEFSSPDAVNNRILTVGIPLGFTQRMKQLINITTQKGSSFRNKQNDLVQVVVYKVDMQNADIVYKPQRFLFEMSRFPTRYTTAAWLPIPSNPSVQDIINSIPTQNFLTNAATATSLTSGVEYASSAIASNVGTKNSRTAFDDESYSFMSSQEKAEVLHNHVVSQLLDSYIKLMTGINVAEYNYDMIEPLPPIESAFVKTMTEHVVANVTEQITARSARLPNVQSPPAGVLFSTTGVSPLPVIRGSFASIAISQPVLSNASGIASNVSLSSLFRAIPSTPLVIKSIDQQAPTDSIDSNLNKLSFRSVPTMLGNMRFISGLSKSISTLSSIDALNSKVLTPKAFDRVFNIIVNPNEFEVDVQKTMQTPYGTQALDLMLKNGDIVQQDENSSVQNQIVSYAQSIMPKGSRQFPQNRQPTNVNSFKLRDRSKSEGDLIADKYFVTIETFDENGDE